MNIRFIISSLFVPTAALLSKRSLLTTRSISTKLNVKNIKRINVYEPKTPSQEEYVEMLNDYKYNMIIANGAAGTGKTLLACQSAIKELYDGNKDKIIITRPVVPVEEEIGFLPGSLNQKMDPWTRPIMDIFNEYHSKNNIKTMMKDNTIEISPLGFMRGRTFKDAFIIADEMQNCSPNQMIMLLTRLGTNSKIVITGDLRQCDKKQSGLKDLLEKLNIYYKYNDSELKKDGIGIVEFNSSDVQRSEIVSKILKIYDQ